MEGFTYHDIFQTKGIEYLIIITFLLLLIPFWLIINKQASVMKFIKSTMGILNLDILKIPKGILFNKNHTWAHLKKSGIAEVGIDDWLLHLTGEVKFTYLRDLDEKIVKGELLTEIMNDGKVLKVFSPISGKIVRTNLVLNDKPEIIKTDPYNEGWVYQIEPSNWKAESSSFVIGYDADSWFSKELQRFKDFVAISMAKISPEMPMTVLQEGGELRDNPLQELPKEVWNSFQKEFLEN